MTDRELDYLMRRVLLDSMEGREDTEAAVPVFTPSGCRDPAGVYSELGQPDGRQSHRAGRGCSLGDRMV